MSPSLRYLSNLGTASGENQSADVTVMTANLQLTGLQFEQTTQADLHQSIPQMLERALGGHSRAELPDEDSLSQHSDSVMDYRRRKAERGKLRENSKSKAFGFL